MNAVSSLHNPNMYNAASYKRASTAIGTLEGTSFNKVFHSEAGSVDAVNGAGNGNTDAYIDYLKSKYGNLTIQSVGKDQKSLDRAGGRMSGSDVVIAPNILEQMASDPEKAKYYEGKIDNYFDNVIPRETANFAGKGLVFEPGGVIVHDDGTVTYMSGCSDSPERVAEVNAINKAKREKEAAQRKESLERSQQAAAERQRYMEERYRKQGMEEALQDQSLDREYFYSTDQVAHISQAISAYEASALIQEDVM